MTRDERAVAVRCLDEIDKALPVTPAAIMGRASSKALRELITKSHGASDHATARKPRRARPEAVNGAPA